MYQKQNSLYEELSLVVGETVSVNLYRRFVESMNSFNDSYLQVLVQMIMYYAEARQLSVLPVEYLVPEIVGFRMLAAQDTNLNHRRRTLIVSKPALALYLFTPAPFVLTQVKSFVKRKKFDDLFKKFNEPSRRTNLSTLRLTLSQKQQALEMFAKLAVVANHVAHHYRLWTLGKDFDYGHEIAPPFFDLQRLVTAEPSPAIRDYVERWH